jgi:hypothetical protein
MSRNAPSHSLIRSVASGLRGIKSTGKPLGKKWCTKFLKRHEGLNTGRGRPKDIQRLTTLTFNLVDLLFDGFEALREKYEVKDQDIWNMDEKGFQMGQLASHPVVFDKRSSPPVLASTGTSKWVSIIECISMTCQTLNPFLIHIGQQPKDA